MEYNILEVYGTHIREPLPKSNDVIINYNLPRTEQKWVKHDLPSFFDKVEYNKSGDLILNTQQWEYAQSEVRKCKEGVWVMINGKVRYIPPKYYFYLQYYILEDGIPPDFREADRKWFSFLKHWEAVDWVLGTCRTKKRRAGASSQACSNLIYEAIFYKNSNCGLISKTKDDSKDTFTEMVTAAYRQLPAFLKPKQVNKEDSVTELVFAYKSQTTKDGTASTIKDDEGHRSKINYRAPVLNAYDRSRQSRILLDEGAKFPRETPTSQLLSILSKTLMKGVKRVGFIELCSTVNEMTKGGGAEYKRIWDSANQFKRKPTLNRLVRFFQPAYEAYEGYIDIYGDSVIENPTQEQCDYLISKWVKYNEHGELISELSEDDIKLGAKHYVMVKRREGLVGMDLEEEIRMNPCDEEEAFMFSGQGCEFNAANINKQIKELEENPPYIRQMRLVPEKQIKKADTPMGKDKERVIAKPMDDEKGGWFILEMPNKPNHFRDRQGYLEPLNSDLYSIGVDTTKENPTPTTDGSKPRICVMKKSCIVDGEETGLYPVAMWLGDNRLDVHFDEQVLLACKWFGCRVNYEIDARTDYYRYFVKQNAQAFLIWTPKVMQNPVKQNGKIEPGVRSGDPFQFSQQTQIIKSYIDGTDIHEYNGHVHRIKYISLLKQLLKFDTMNRTPFDEVISLIMALVPMFAEEKRPVLPTSQLKVLPQYSIKLPA